MRPLILPAFALLSACAAPNADEEALSRDLAGRVAGEARACIPTNSSTSLTIADRRTLTLRLGDTVWVNRLEADCPGFRPLATLLVEVDGSQYCRGDKVRAVEAGSSIPGPLCVLGEFTPYRRGGPAG
jgi:hypothetical protein